ncbi:hypothetical protein HK100_010225, partial [Physocladia obscura]
GPYPIVYNDTILISEDGSDSFNLLGACPWNLDRGQSQLLTDNLSRYMNTTRILETAICVVSAASNLLLFFLGYKTYKGNMDGMFINSKEPVLNENLDIFFTAGFLTQLVAAIYFGEKKSSDQATLLSTPWLLGPIEITTTIFPNDTTTSPKNLVIPLSAAGILASVIAYAIGWNAIRRCNAGLMYVFLAILLVDLGAVLFGLHEVFMNPSYAITKDSLALFC